VRFEISASPKISILIPSTVRVAKEGAGKSITLALHREHFQKSTWREFEIIVLDRNQMPLEMEARLSRRGVRRVRTLRRSTGRA